MKKPNKTWRRLLSISLILLSCLLLVACGDEQGASNGPAVSAISISDAAKPQTVFPEGQELDLSKGSLTVVYDSGKKETIALNAEGVTVTGYDKNKLGDQSLIVTYGGRSISLTVTVAKRMTFAGYETNYFVGDPLDLDKGKVTIVKDDGNIANVRLNDSSISVVSFDSATAGKGKEATIRYSADGKEYTGTIAVNVYAVADIKFVKPTKGIYGSHDTELNLQGGYFTVTAEGNDELTKSIPLEQSMVSGFDPSVTSKDNVDEALVQTITVNYAGQSYSFDIRLFYSGVSIMQDTIENLKHIDLNADEFTITEEDAQIAREGIDAYLALTHANREFLVSEDVNRVARIYAIYARAHANQLGQSMADAVIFIDGEVKLANNSNYEAVENARNILSDPNCELVHFHMFLKEFVEEFGPVYVAGEITVAQYVGVIGMDMFDSVVDGLTFMMQIHDDLAVIPEEWVAIDLIANRESIDNAVFHFSTFNNPQMIPIICQIVSQWRVKNDLLEIIYAYYYYYMRGVMMDEIGHLLPFPGPLQEVYMLISKASSLSASVEGAGAQALWHDNTTFYYYYYLTMEQIQLIEDHENWIYRGLYNFLDFDSLFKGYVLYPNVGVVNMMGSVYKDEQVTALMDNYMDLVMKTMTGETPNLNFEENKDQFQSIIDQFVALTPGKQRQFLSSLFYLYGLEKVNDSMLLTLPEEGEKGIFLFMLKSYFAQYMSEATMPMVQDMLLAMEYYMNRDFYDNAMENFNLKMEGLNTAYAALSAKDKALFDQYVGDAFVKYNLLYRLEKNGASIDQEQYVNRFSELVQLYHEFETLLNNMTDPETNKFNEGVLGMTVATYTRAVVLTEQLLALDNQEIVALFSVLDITWDEENKFDLDYLYMSVRMLCLRALHDIPFKQFKEDGTEKTIYAWEVYHEVDMSKLLYDVYYVMRQAYDGAEEYDAAQVVAAMKAFRESALANPRTAYIFSALDCDTMYYKGLEAFFEQVLDDSNKEIAAKLLEAEKAYCSYASAMTSQDKVIAYMMVMQELMRLRESVTATENFDAYLAEMYNFYLEQYNAIEFDFGTTDPDVAA